MSSSSTISFFSRLVEGVLGWFQQLVNQFVNAASNNSGRLLSGFLSAGWKGLLVILLVGGVVLNIVIYIQRWKPHWWWFAKKRMVVDDGLVQQRKKPAPGAHSAAAGKASTPKPSTYIPKRVRPQTNGKTKDRQPDAADEEEDDFMSTGNDDLMAPHRKRRQ